jgi:hypothetical protein
MPKTPIIKRIQLDKPTEQMAVLNDKLQAVEVELKKTNPGFKLPKAEVRK